MLHRDGHDQAAQEHVVGRVQIVDGHLTGGHQAQQRQTNLVTMRELISAEKVSKQFAISTLSFSRIDIYIKLNYHW